MMPSVSIRARVVATGVAVVAVVLVGLDVFVYLSLRDRLVGSLEHILDSRAELAERLAPPLSAPDLARLAGSGVHVVVRSADGRILAEEPKPPAPPSDHVLTRRVTLPDGEVVGLSLSQYGVDQTLQRLVIWEAAGTGVGLVVAALLLARTSRIALRPLGQVVETARRIRAGRTGERLSPRRIDTELGRMAVAFDEMLDALEAALDEARSSEDETRRFLAEAAHQLRTPITGIQASVESLAYTRTREEREQLLANVGREASRAGRRVAGLLRMARLDHGDRPARRSCDLVSLCRTEVERVRLLAPRVEVSFRASLDPWPMEVDADAMREALGNLLDNASRYAASRIDVSLEAKSGAAELVVADDGPGLPQGAAERAFEPFVALDTHGGSGLGLAIARAIARAHGGDVVHERAGFVIRLPTATDGPPPPGPDGPVTVGQSEDAAGSKRRSRG